MIAILYVGIATLNYSIPHITCFGRFLCFVCENDIDPTIIIKDETLGCIKSINDQCNNHVLPKVSIVSDRKLGISYFVNFFFRILERSFTRWWSIWASSWIKLLVVSCDRCDCQFNLLFLFDSMDLHSCVWSVMFCFFFLSSLFFLLLNHSNWSFVASVWRGSK